MAQLGPLLTQLNERAAGTEWLRPQAAQLETLVRDRMAELANLLPTAEAEGFGPARALALTDAGGETMQRAEAMATQISRRAEFEWAVHARKLRERQSQVTLLSLGALVGALILLGVAGLRMLWIRVALLRAREGERREMARLAAALENIKDGFAVFDRRDRLVLQNTRFASVLGLSATPAPGACLGEVAAGSALHPALAGPRPHAKPIINEAGDASRVLEIWRSAMPDGGQIVAVADITRRVRAETIARQAQKMETLGQMTGASPTTSTTCCRSCRAISSSLPSAWRVVTAAPHCWTGSPPPAPAWRAGRS